MFMNLEGVVMNMSLCAEFGILIGNKLVRLIDMTFEQWLDIKFEDCRNIDPKTKVEEQYTWYKRSYKDQFEDYREVMRKKDLIGTYGYEELNTDDPEFIHWLSSKFYNYMKMDAFAKNALWFYWSRGDDEVERTNDDGFSKDCKIFEEDLGEQKAVAKLFRIETNIFDY